MYTITVDADRRFDVEADVFRIEEEKLLFFKRTDDDPERAELVAAFARWEFVNIKTSGLLA